MAAIQILPGHFYLLETFLSNINCTTTPLILFHGLFLCCDYLPNYCFHLCLVPTCASPPVTPLCICVCVCVVPYCPLCQFVGLPQEVLCFVSAILLYVGFISCSFIIFHFTMKLHFKHVFLRLFIDRLPHSTKAYLTGTSDQYPKTINLSSFRRWNLSSGQLTRAEKLGNKIRVNSHHKLFNWTGWVKL